MVEKGDLGGDPQMWRKAPKFWPIWTSTVIFLYILLFYFYTFVLRGKMVEKVDLEAS